MNKLRFKIADVAEKHGLKNAYALQKKLDCSPTLAARLWKGNFKQIGIDTIEKLCDLFDCVPSDLYTYPAKNKPANVPETASGASDSEKGNRASVQSLKAEKDGDFLIIEGVRYYNTKQIAERLDRKPRTVRDLFKSGKLERIKRGQESFVAESVLESFIESQFGN